MECFHGFNIGDLLKIKGKRGYGVSMAIAQGSHIETHCIGSGRFGRNFPVTPDMLFQAGSTKDDFFLYAGCGGEGDVGYAGLTAQVEAMKLLPDTFVYCENFSGGNLYYTQCSGGHSTKAVEQIMYAALPTFFDK